MDIAASVTRGQPDVGNVLILRRVRRYREIQSSAQLLVGADLAEGLPIGNQSSLQDFDTLNVGRSRRRQKRQRRYNRKHKHGPQPKCWQIGH